MPGVTAPYIIVPGIKIPDIIMSGIIQPGSAPVIGASGILLGYIFIINKDVCLEVFVLMYGFICLMPGMNRLGLVFLPYLRKYAGITPRPGYYA
jgi:hypothetical protein